MMRRREMAGSSDELEQAYRSALQDYLGGAGEAALSRAYEIGRKAIVDKVALLDLAAIHHKVLVETLEGARSRRDVTGAIRLAADLFTECLSPFEMTHRGFQEANATLMRVNEALAAANMELEAFSYSVSHDLRALLRSINGFSQAIMEDYADRLDDQGKEYFSRIMAACNRMSQLIDGLLGLARITRSEMHRVAVNLSAMARTIASDLKQAEPERHVDFTIMDDVYAWGDARLLQVVMENLLGNAWKYTARHEHARIEFGTTGDDGERVYFVRDDGAGFDMAYVDKLFTPFSRLHGSSEFEGIGIGLATVPRIIHRHGGTIWAEGAVEKGATFYFTLGFAGGRCDDSEDDSAGGG
ncbi:MAG: ATP-binding protein [Bacillota bacterium]